MIPCKIYNESSNVLPVYKTPLSSGFDLRANLEVPLTLKSFGHALISTGLHIELPEGNYEFQVRPRSGLTSEGILVILGTVDNDYRGDIKINIFNFSGKDFVINPGDRIAQGVISQFVQVSFKEVPSLEDLSETKRGQKGIGHTGIK